MKNQPFKKAPITWFLFFMTCFCSFMPLVAQTKNDNETNEKFTISGYVYESTSEESLIGASVYNIETKQGTHSNIYGFYSLTLPQGMQNLQFSYLGFSSIDTTLALDQNLSLNIYLSEGMELETVEIIADDNQPDFFMGSQMSNNKIDLASIKSLPALMGERDVLKIMQLMPGVQSGTEGSSGLYIRGGGPDQNLVLLDGVPVYNANHLFGFLSTFNGDAIKNVALTKGGYPARFGERLSSIIDIRMKDGNMEKYKGNVSLGLVSGKFSLEGPILKNKTSFIISTRRTWLDLLTTPIQKGAKNSDPTTKDQSAISYHFYDLNLKIKHKFSDKNRLYLSFYGGDDEFKDEWDRYYSKGQFNIGWGNKVAAIRWNQQLSSKLFGNTTLSYTKYNYQSINENSLIENTQTLSQQSLETTSQIQDVSLKYDLDFVPSPTHYIRTGISFTNHRFTPTVNTAFQQEGTDNPIIVSMGESALSVPSMSSYIEDDLILAKSWKMNIGARYAYFSPKNTKYTSLQPRLSLAYQINHLSSLKASISKMTQFVHLLTSPGLGLPTDLWVPSTPSIKPEIAWQVAISYQRKLLQTFDVTIEGFAKQMNNLLEYKTGFSVFSDSESWEDKVTIGNGKSIGAELLFEKKAGKTTGWIGYTLSSTTRQFPDLNLGNEFPYKYDRRHDFSLTLMHKPNDRFDVGLVWIYGTGHAYSLGTQSYLTSSAGPGNDEYLGGSGLVSYLPNKNNLRAPAYHRLDLSINIHKDVKMGKRTWSFGLYNAYNRLNPFLFFIESNEEGKLQLKKLSILPIIPFFSYSIDF